MHILSLTVCLLAELPILQCHEERFVAFRPQCYNQRACNDLAKQAGIPWMIAHPGYFVADWACKETGDEYS